MHSFEYNPSKSRVISGSGTLAKLPQELSHHGVTRPLLLSMPDGIPSVGTVRELLHGCVAHVFDGAKMHTPIEVTERAVEYAKSVWADCVVSIGGGSTIGLGKAISIRTGLFHLAIPTTYAGSEATPILGETKAGNKTTTTDPRILPGVILYDVDLTLTLPAPFSGVSGINAIAHAVEAISMLALEGIKSLATSLPQLSKSPGSLSSRSLALYGAWLCGTCLGNTSMALHHKLCHILGGSFNLPHAETHAIILPHALSYNAPRVHEAMEVLAGVLPGSDGDALKGLDLLSSELNIKRSLKSLGMKEEDIAKAADLVTIRPYWNPRNVERNAIHELIRRAWAGEKARADL